MSAGRELVRNRKPNGKTPSGGVGRAIASGLTALMALAIAPASAGALGNAYVVPGLAQDNPAAEMRCAVGAGGETVLMLPDAASGTTRINRYDRHGAPIWSAPQVLPGVPLADLATDRLGNYVVVEEAEDHSAIHAAVYTRDGGVLTPRFRVDPGSGQAWVARVAMNNNGVFAVAWQEDDGSGWQAIRARVFERDGTPLSAVLTAASGNGAGRPRGPWDFAIDAAGRFSLVWEYGAEGQSFSRVGTIRFDAAGNVVQPFDIGSDPWARASRSTIAGNQNGDQVGVWLEHNDLSYRGAIRFQRYAPSGAKLGGPVTVDEGAASAMDPRVGVAEDGGFVVMWAAGENRDDWSSPPRMWARQYRKDGSPVGSTFRIDQAPANVQVFGFHELCVGHSGRFLPIWGQYDGSTVRMHARPYLLDEAVAATELSSGVAVGGLAGASGSFRYYKLFVPPGQASFSVTMSGAGDADLFLKHGSAPTEDVFDLSPARDGSNEGVLVNNPPTGEFYIGVFGYSGYSDVTVQADL